MHGAKEKKSHLLLMPDFGIFHRTEWNSLAVEGY
jgi:hypothetical protein